MKTIAVTTALLAASWIGQVQTQASPAKPELQISFVKRGIPGVFLDLGIKAIDPGVDVPALRSKWRTTVYHSPKDDMTQPIHYPSSVRFAQFLSEAARAVADAPARPRWNDGDFFGRRMADRGP